MVKIYHYLGYLYDNIFVARIETWQVLTQVRSLLCTDLGLVECFPRAVRAVLDSVELHQVHLLLRRLPRDDEPVGHLGHRNVPGVTGSRTCNHIT